MLNVFPHRQNLDFFFKEKGDSEGVEKDQREEEQGMVMGRREKQTIARYKCVEMS